MVEKSSPFSSPVRRLTNVSVLRRRQCRVQQLHEDLRSCRPVYTTLASVRHVDTAALADVSGEGRAAATQVRAGYTSQASSIAPVTSPGSTLRGSTRGDTSSRPRKTYPVCGEGVPKARQRSAVYCSRWCAETANSRRRRGVPIKKPSRERQCLVCGTRFTQTSRR